MYDTGYGACLWNDDEVRYDKWTVVVLQYIHKNDIGCRGAVCIWFEQLFRMMQHNVHNLIHRWAYSTIFAKDIAIHQNYVISFKNKWTEMIQSNTTLSPI